MPVYSMTGYASCQEIIDAAAGRENSPLAPQSPAAANDWRLQLELRSVNSRFLDITLKLTEELRPFEGMLRELLQKHLRRGKVELRAGLEKPVQTPGHALPLPGAELLQRIASVQQAIQTCLPQASGLGVADILQLARSSHMAELPPDQVQAGLQTAMQGLLEAFQAARQTEGGQLAHSLLQRSTQLRTLAVQAEPLVAQVVAQQRQRFLDKWNDALAAAAPSVAGTATPLSAEAAQERALTEAAAFALRIDVAEELTRLQAHLDTIDALLHKGGELGKRLEFLIQELHREANTLGSKSAALETSRIAVDMKVLIEQMREQVQNIE